MFNFFNRKPASAPQPPKATRPVKLVEAPQAEAPKPVEGPGGMPKEEEAETCHTCGAPNPVGTEECLTCGNTLGDKETPEPTVADRADQKLQKLEEAVIKENEDSLAYRAQRKAEILRQEELIEKKALLAKAAEELRAARKRSEAELANLAVTCQFGAVVDESVESFIDDLEAEFGI